MVKKVFSDIAASARELWRRWPVTASFVGLYALMLASIYFFAAMGQASLWQVLLTLLLFLAAPVLFFVLQAMGVNYTQDGTGIGVLLRRSLRECWKLILISIPVFLLAWLIVCVKAAEVLALKLVLPA